MREPFVVDVGVASRAKAGEPVCGDVANCHRLDDGRVLLVLADGLGHGSAAAAAATDCVATLTRLAPLGLHEAFQGAHAALRNGRGAVAAVVAVDPKAGVAEAAVIGNISVRWVGTRGVDVRTSTAVAVPGVLGGAFRKIMPQRFDLGVGDIVIVHSDGITSHFDTLRARALDAGNAAAEILAVHGRSYDDASCVVARVLPPLATVVRAEASAPCEEERELPIRVDGDVYVAATAARAFARDAGLSPRGQWEVGIAASELAQNAVKYGVEGRLLFKRIARGEVVLEVFDRGPGFGASAERPGLREGLAAVRRLMDSCEVWSTPLGSRVVARKKEPGAI